MDEGHSGRPLVRRTDYGRVLILCPAGHLVQTVKAEDWNGSEIERRCGSPSYMVTCHGQLS